jgi:hypothetical protein
MQKPNNNRPDRGKNRKAGNAPKLTAEQERDLLAKQLRLKPKSKATIDEILANPDISNTEAYIRHHKTDNRASARASVAKLLAKPNVIGYKDAAVKKAKNRIVELVDSNNDNTALKAAQDIIDRNEGKAIQKSENVSRVIEVKLDLTGVRIGAHYVAPELQDGSD